MRVSNWLTAVLLVGGALATTACSTYPEGPRYSTRPMTGYGAGAAAAQPAYPAPTPPPYEAPPPSTAPYASIEGGALPPPSSNATTGALNGGGYTPPPPAYAPPASSRPVAAPAYNPPSAPVTVSAGAVYTIRSGDTISGVGRRFQTPVQTLIDLNGLGPRGTISAGQAIVLPDSAVDTGPDPYAMGPAPVGVMVPESGVLPPPPPPPSGNPAAPPPSRQPAASGVVGSAPTASSVALQWPLRGEVVRRFGPVGMGERNNGINIGASAGASVMASADGRVAYVGDDLVGQGLTVLIVHRDGWRTVYGHLGSATVSDGSDVRAGQQIGTVGLTAGDGRPSIHYETRRMQGDEPVAIDPLTVLPR
ncbi:peptidase M23 [Brevundimonas sp. LM2]|uniref:peptidoglycan DD-metalloendopeptidase family protein n=1 Tax=Brevundimonas sp. LM2 TaxID=1938605 RepID=UPI000983B38B|nr:peptidoglycan DD-metalloendopeptidase family protein [Brevundimonas sp. LM2]AQR62259.1 peptidase M23 [Brevundimonas sp. LM2]